MTPAAAQGRQAAGTSRRPRGAPNPAGRAAAVFSRVPAAIALSILAYAALELLGRALDLVRFPFPVDYGEAAMLNQTVCLARLETIYPVDLTRPPYLIWNFPALFSLVQVPALAWFGPALWYGRLLSTASLVVAAAGVAATLHALTRDRLAACVGGLCLLAIPMVSFWASLNRVDALALALSWVGLALVARRPHRRAPLIAAGLLLTAAVYTRQSYGLAAPLAAFVWLWARHGVAPAKRLAAVVAGSGLGLLVVLSWATDGGFLLHVVTANFNEYELGIAGDLLLFLVALMPVYFAAVVLFLARRPGRASVWWLGATYLLGASVSAATAGKVGSNVNYFFELLAGASFAVGACVAAARPVGQRVLFAALALQVAVLLAFESPQQQEVERRRGAVAELESLQAMVERADGPVLADEYLAMLPLAGKPIYMQPFIFTQLVRVGSWDPAPFLADLEAQAFPLIALDASPDSPTRDLWWTPEMRAAIDRRYAVSETLPGLGLEIYRPRPAAREASHGPE